MKKQSIVIVAGVSLFILGGVFGFWRGQTAVQSLQRESEFPVRVQQGQVGLINPLLECEGAQFQETPSFMSQIRERIASDKRLTKVAVYFRDLNNGPWFGINEREEFVAASLMKVGLLMSFMKATESHPEVLAQRLKLKPEDMALNEIQQTGTFSKLESGVSYTVEELLSRVIIESDNRPIVALMESRLAPPLEETMGHLGIPFKVLPQVGTVITLKAYANLFRVLYNASYLTAARSHQALELMTRATFKEGLVAGVPEGVTVAHKFGERILEKGLQLHNCGIIYVPQKPYLLCIMTQGKDFPALKSVISDISRIAYKAVVDQKSPLAQVGK